MILHQQPQPLRRSVGRSDHRGGSHLSGPSGKADRRTLSETRRRSSSRRPRSLGRCHQARHPAATSEPERLASPTRRAEHPPMAPHGQSQATGRTGHRPADTEAWISFGGSLENGSRGFHRVSSIALVASDQPACIMTTRQCSHISSNSSRERHTCERERSPFTSSTTSQPSWWVWREQTARSSRSLLCLRNSKPVPSDTGWPSQTERWRVLDMGRHGSTFLAGCVSGRFCVRLCASPDRHHRARLEGR